MALPPGQPYARSMSEQDEGKNEKGEAPPDQVPDQDPNNPNAADDLGMDWQQLDEGVVPNYSNVADDPGMDWEEIDGEE